MHISVVKKSFKSFFATVQQFASSTIQSKKLGDKIDAFSWLIPPRYIIRYKVQEIL